jgi:integrase
MAKNLTPISIRNLRPRVTRYEIGDAGCRGLRVVVFPSGCKSFVTRFRYRGLQRKLTLGPALIDHSVAEPNGEPQLDTPLTLSAARELCTKALRQAKSGVDPTAEKRRTREALTAAEGDTLQAIAEEYLRREGGKLRTLSQRESDLGLLSDSPLGRLPVTEIKRGQYHRELDKIADERGPVRADRALAALKRLLSWHAERSDFVSPLGRGGRRTSPKELARSRVLTDDELRRVWTAAETYPGPFGAFVRFALLTATRRGESAGLHRGELSDDGRTWVIPGSRYKNGCDTLIPLSEAAQAIIAAQPELGDFVFSADGSRPMSGFDARKADFDKVAGVHDYRLHDLRRTGRTLLSRAGIPTDIAERCLGHSKTGVRSTYDRHEYETEKRSAFEALAQVIERIVRPAPAVADIGEARKRRRDTRR